MIVGNNVFILIGEYLLWMYFVIFFKLFKGISCNFFFLIKVVVFFIFKVLFIGIINIKCLCFVFFRISVLNIVLIFVCMSFVIFWLDKCFFGILKLWILYLIFVWLSICIVFVFLFLVILIFYLYFFRIILIF